MRWRPICRDRTLARCRQLPLRPMPADARAFCWIHRGPPFDFKLDSSDSLKWYQSSPQARRGFCSICGASLFWVPEGGDHVAIAAGTLDQPTGLRTVAHIFVADAGDYYTIADGLKRPRQDCRGAGGAPRLAISLDPGDSRDVVLAQTPDRADLRGYRPLFRLNAGVGRHVARNRGRSPWESARLGVWARTTSRESPG